jgi:hypothetical protein
MFRSFEFCTVLPYYQVHFCIVFTWVDQVDAGEGQTFIQETKHLAPRNKEIYNCVDQAEGILTLC